MDLARSEYFKRELCGVTVPAIGNYRIYVEKDYCKLSMNLTRIQQKINIFHCHFVIFRSSREN